MNQQQPLILIASNHGKQLTLNLPWDSSLEELVEQFDTIRTFLGYQTSVEEYYEHKITSKTPRQEDEE